MPVESPDKAPVVTPGSHDKNGRAAAGDGPPGAAIVDGRFEHQSLFQPEMLSGSRTQKAAA